ncbi:FIST signal transduction protein [Dokdonella sp.]|uniref:FIST signal transduction protein n=1 Tax=Dokdonella sp. TaxID=2291710 RepID=UPI003C31F2FF
MKDDKHACFFEGGRIADLQANAQCLVQAGAKSLMILASEADAWQPDQVNPWLQSLSVPVFGGIFPNIIHGAQRHTSGTLVIGFSEAVEVAVVEGLSDEPGLEPQLQVLTSFLEGATSLITLVDGLSSNIESFVDSLYEILGARAPVVGGGAGCLDFVQRPSLFCPQGMIEDAALLVSLQSRIDSGIAHGWQKLEGPFLVTRSRANVLEELNFRPAFDVYRQAVEAHSGMRFSEADFFSISKTYPLGIESVDGDFLVRDPIRCVDKHLVCVGEVPQNATVYLLKGDAPLLIASAGEAADRALRHRRARMNGEDPSSYRALAFDCISRVLFLDDRFSAELQAINSALPGVASVVGALTLGEIANSKCGAIELMNKSTVVSVY